MTRIERQSITLVKTRDGTGRLRAGARFTTRHSTDISHAKAVRRAYSQLVGYSTEENPKLWNVQEDRPA